ncbi:H-2 class I histocompatibility antigen, Q9 alpha chain-like isoform 1-T1 [Clarias gariepinus]
MPNDTHTLQYLYTSNGHFTAVGLVDGEQFVSYDRNIDKMIPKTEWVKNIEVNDTGYWDRETQHMKDQQDWFQGFVYQTKKSFNPTKDRRWRKHRPRPLTVAQGQLISGERGKNLTCRAGDP